MCGGPELQVFRVLMKKDGFLECQQRLQSGVQHVVRGQQCQHPGSSSEIQTHWIQNYSFARLPSDLCAYWSLRSTSLGSAWEPQQGCPDKLSTKEESGLSTLEHSPLALDKILQAQQS